MKRLLSLLLALLLTMLPALAESHEAHVFAPENTGIMLKMDDSWFHTLAANLYANADRSTSDPCEYSDLFFIYVNDQYPDGLLMFALSNRLTGSTHVPDTHNFPAMEMSQPLMEENGRELLLWYAADLPEALMLPIDRLLAHPEDVSISEPVSLPEAVGFDALYGVNASDLTEVTADILAGKKITMVNVWATYCNPCISEMPELAKLHADYADKGFQIVGMISDVGDAQNIDTDGVDYARLIIEKTGADYLHVIPGEGMFYGVLGEVTAVPTTCFIDESGAVLRTEVGSRNYAGWAAIVDELLAGME